MLIMTRIFTVNYGFLRSQSIYCENLIFISELFFHYGTIYLICRTEACSFLLQVIHSVESINCMSHEKRKIGALLEVQ